MTEKRKLYGIEAMAKMPEARWKPKRRKPESTEYSFGEMVLSALLVLLMVSGGLGSLWIVLRVVTFVARVLF